MNTPSDDTRIDEIRERTAKATPGPWSVRPDAYEIKRGWREIFSARHQAVIRTDCYTKLVAAGRLPEENEVEG